MKRKKIVTYVKRFFLVLTILFVLLFFAGGMYMNHLGKQIYGGLTERVDTNQFKPETGSFAVRNVNLLSEDGERMINNQTILITDGKIAAVDSILSLSSEVKVIDGTGKYLIPGLIDAHIHLFQSPNDLLLYTANGVTEIRELIGEPEHLIWKKEIEAGRIGPKMHVFSPRIGSFEPMEGWMMSYTQGYENINGVDDAKETIQEFYDEGYDGIKVYSQVNKESYIAINETAKKLGLPVVGHVPWELGFKDIWEHGQSDIVHFEELMNALGREFNSERTLGGYKGKDEEFLNFVNERSDVLAQNLIKNKVTVTSSLWLSSSFSRQPFEDEMNQLLKEVALVYENPGISEWSDKIPGGLGWFPNVHRLKTPPNQTAEELASSKQYWATYAKATQLVAKNMAKRGVTIMAGTDANLPPTIPGFSLHDELNSLSSIGMSNVAILKAATSIPASVLNSNSGKIAVGYEANLLLLSKNPLEDIANTKTIKTVISKGQVFDRTLLDKMLEAVKQANDISRTVDISKYFE